MSTHLGRNPFSKKTPPAPVAASTPERAQDSPPLDQGSTLSTSSISKPAQWLLIELPAKSFLLGLKTLLKMKQAFDKK